MSADISQTDAAKLAIERERLTLEATRLRLELRRAWIGPVSVAVPLLVAALGLIATTCSAARQSRIQTQMKAAELVLNNTDPELAYAKAAAFKALFPKELPSSWPNGFRPGNFCRPTFDDKILFARLTLDHPNQRGDIAQLWLTIFCEQQNEKFTYWLRGQIPPAQTR